MDPSRYLFNAPGGSNITIYIIVIIILVILSAFFSGTETAYTSANKIKLKSMEAAGKKRAGKVLKQIDNYERLLSTLLIGNNVVNITMSSLSVLLFVELLNGKYDLATTLSTIVITVIVLIFGEITPKCIAKELPEKVAMAVSPIVTGLSIILYPINMIFAGWKWLLKKIFRLENNSSITEDELITMVEEAENEGGLDEHESKLIRSAIEFEDLDVGDIMVPRIKVISTEDDATMEEIYLKFRENGFSRMPVYHDTIDSIIGIIHEKDFFALYHDNRNDIRSIVQNSVCLSINMKISAALRQMQRDKVHMAVVVDEFGGTAGIITMEDILEELVGEIWDEHDEVEELLIKNSDDEFTIKGECALLDAFDAMDADPKEEFESTTVGGWITEILKRIPEKDEVFEYKCFTIKVTEASNKTVEEVRISVNRDYDEDEEESGEIKEKSEE